MAPVFSVNYVAPDRADQGRVISLSLYIVGGRSSRAS
jgi:hypothetical protein